MIHVSYGRPEDPQETERWEAMKAPSVTRGRDTASAEGPSDGYLTPIEREAIERAGQLWNVLCRVVGDGPSRSGDLAELVPHIHAIQQAVMSQAAARAYPDTYRLLGSTLRTER